MTYGPEHWHCQIGAVKPKGNIALFPGTLAPELPVHEQPADSVVELLAGLLDRAKSGELRAIAVAYVKANSCTSYDWAQSPIGHTIHPLCASVADLSFAFAAQRARLAEENADAGGR